MATRPEHSPAPAVDRGRLAVQVLGGVLAGFGGVVVSAAVYAATSGVLLLVAVVGACGVGFALRRHYDYRIAATGWLAGFGVGLLISALDRFV
ncbi:MAG TPA: hypothetical protein VFZ83_10780 [Acidimicrobiia bacterium]|nr:hypothetical protein [Acidimicrobiia bacterium]